MENTTSQNSNNIISTQSINNDKIKANIIFTYDITIDIQNPNYTLLDLKHNINKSYSIQENEYYLLIGEEEINNLPNDTCVHTVLKKYNQNKITIKSYKNSFDIEKQLNDYEKILEKKILVTNDEINSLNLEYEKLTQDLINI